MQTDFQAVGIAAPVAAPRAAGSAAELKVLQLGAEWFPERGGGLNRFFHELLRVLPTTRVECRGFVAGTPEKWPRDDGAQPQAFAAMTTSLPRRWLAERRVIADAIATERFDLAVSHFAMYAFPVLNALTSPQPLVVHFHGPWAQESRAEGGRWLACAAKAAIERAVYRRASRIIVLSAPFKQVLVRDCGVQPDRIRVVPGGVNCDRFGVPESRAEARAKLGWPGGRPVVLSVRRLARRMGLENLVEAADVVRRAIPDVLVYIAGGGGQREPLEEAIRHRGLGSTVRLLGFVPDNLLPLAYRAADLTVVPSISLEGFGLVAGESLAAGTPVLATPIGGLVDLLGPLSERLLFTGTRAADIAAGLGAALADPSALPGAAECAAYARRRFDWRVVAAGIADVYRDAVRQP